MPSRTQTHAQKRLRQRGFRQCDVELVLANGVDCDEATVLTDQAARQAIAVRKQEIIALERLRGAAVVVAGDAIATVYRPGRGRMRRFLRSAPHSHSCRAD